MEVRIRRDAGRQRQAAFSTGIPGTDDMQGSTTANVTGVAPRTMRDAIAGEAGGVEKALVELRSNKLTSLGVH